MDISSILDTYQAARDTEDAYEAARSAAHATMEQATDEMWVSIFLVLMCVVVVITIWVQIQTRFEQLISVIPMLCAGALLSVTVSGIAASGIVEYDGPPPPPAGSISQYSVALNQIGDEVFTTYGVIVPEETLEEAFVAEDDDIALFTATHEGVTKSFGVTIDETAQTVTVYQDGKKLTPVD